MASKVIVEVTDDLDGSRADETIKFTMDEHELRNRPVQDSHPRTTWGAGALHEGRTQDRQEGRTQT